MKLLDRIFASPELLAEPPVLVDVGAAGGVNPIWRGIARYSIGLGFEPDARDIGGLSEASRTFRRWIYCEGLVAPAAEKGGSKTFYLTQSPHCSSLLKPRNDALQEWLFADLFEVKKTVSFSAVTLHAALADNGLHGVDWLKCDTQGQDLSIFLSLPEEWRRRTLAVEFEPGLIDAYQGEDKLWRTLQAMEDEPFWMCDLHAGVTQRGHSSTLSRSVGGKTARWVSRLAPCAPAWVNVRYLRSAGDATESLDRRGLLLSWVFSDLLGQHTHALVIAEEGQRRFGSDLFVEMQAASVRRLRRAMLSNLPWWLWRRLGFGA